MSNDLEYARDPGGAPAEDAAQSQVRLSEYWGVLVKHRRLIAVCVAAALAVAALITVLSKPSYKATAVLAVEKERQTPLDSNWTPQIYASLDPEFLPTQTRLMKSREIAERVVQRLNLVENRELHPKTSGFFQKGEGAAGLSQHAITRTAMLVLGGIEVAPIRGTSLVELSYVGPSPKIAADIANGLAEAYVAWNQEAKARLVGEASEFLTSQIDELKKEIDAKEQQLLAYSREKDIVSMNPGTNVTLQKLESLNSDYAAAVAERVAREARYHEVQNARPEAIGDAGGNVEHLRAEQARLEREYAEKLNVFKPEWPAMVQMKTQIEKGREYLNATIQGTLAKAREAAKSEYMTALRREASLRSVLQTQKSEAMTLNTNAVEYNNLQIEAATKRALLDTLVKRQAEIGMISRLGGGVSNVRVVDRALPPGGRFKPSYKKNALFGLLAGAVFGIGLAFALSYLDRSMRTAEQVEQHLRLPALGVSRAVGGSGKRQGYGSRLMGRRKKAEESEEERAIELLPHEHARSRMAEAYRAFRTALLLSRAGGVKTIVITSSFSQEGKTATAINLAVVLGQLGKRVLLVDADLHKPRIHEVLRLSNRVGLVSILAENLGPPQAILKTDLPGVSVITSGPASPNPSGLLSSEGMVRLLDMARMNFDYIVLDTPPVLPVADALVLGHQSDGVVLCVKGGHTPREKVSHVRDKLLRSNVRILGVLINNLEEEAGPYGRRYSDDYGYYGERDRATAEKSATRLG